MEQKPTVGRTVHYHADPKKDWALPHGEPLAAIIARVDAGGHVVLAVINPEGNVPILRVYDAPLSELPEPGCWSWPPRV